MGTLENQSPRNKYGETKEALDDFIGDQTPLVFCSGSI